MSTNTKRDSWIHHGAFVRIVLAMGVLNLANVCRAAVDLPEGFPAIIWHPQSQTVTAGINISLTVVASGAAPLSYQWKRNGVDITNATGSALALNNVQAADLGSYTVVVSNAIGSALSNPAIISGIERFFNGHAYDVTPQGMEWNEAENWAKSRGGHLVAINSQAEQDFLLRNFGAEPSYWIGLSDQAAEGDWSRWSNGEPATYGNWASGEPNNANAGEAFAMMNWNTNQGISGLGQWNDLPGGRTPGIIEYVIGGARAPAQKKPLEAKLIVPNALGRHVTATLYVECTNNSTVAIPAPLLLVRSADRALLTLDPARVVAGFWSSVAVEGFADTVQILASGAAPGVLAPGESVRVPVYYAGLQQPWNFGDSQLEFEVGALTADSEDPIDWSTLKGRLRPASMSDAGWEAVWTNFVAGAGHTWGEYVTMLNDNAAFLGRIGRRVVDVNQLLGFELLQADGLGPVRVLAAASDAQAAGPGLDLVFARSFGAAISPRFEVGAFGRGWTHNWQYSAQRAGDGTVTILGPAGSRRMFHPDSRAGTRYFTQPGDHGVLAALPGGGFTLSETDGLVRAFRSDGRLDYVAVPNGNRITARWTGDLLTRLEHSNGRGLDIIHDGGLIRSITDPIGRTTAYSYDTAQHLTGVRYASGQEIGYEYNTIAGAPGEHALTQINESGGTHKSVSYDAAGRLAGTSLSSGAEALGFAYDSAGRVTVTDALGHATRHFFDYRGLLARTEDALGHPVQMTFDDEHNLVELTDPAGGSYRYTYDSKGNVIEAADPLGATTRFAHAGAFNRLASVTDAKANLTRYTYTTEGDLQSITYADGSVERWTYDANGNASGWTNRRGRTIAYARDNDGRLTTKTLAGESRTTFDYDVRGNLTSTTDATGTTRFDYDARDWLTRITYPTGPWLQFTYDAAGRRATSLDQLGHRLNYGYDAAGRLEQLTDEQGRRIVHYTFDAAGRLAGKTLANGLTATYAYDTAGQLLVLTNALASGGTLSRFAYAYNDRGRRTAMETLEGRWTYDYDALGQLTRAAFASTNPAVVPNQDLAYVYDALGNRIRTVENGVTTEYSSNNLNQYVRTGDTTYRFDADGNLVQEATAETTTTYTYDDENRLVAVRRGTDTWSYGYDAFGGRVTSSENGVTTRFVLDPIGLGNVVGEYDAAGELIARYDHGFGLLARADPAGIEAYYAFDALGSVQQVVTAAGEVANRYTYAPFGGLIGRTETLPNPFQFVGQVGVMSESSGLGFMRARFYSGQCGRFIQADPIGLAGGLNLYAYTMNDPIGVDDPSGKFVPIAVQLGVGVIAYYVASRAFVYWPRIAPVVSIVEQLPEGVPGPVTDIGGLAGFGLKNGRDLAQLSNETLYGIAAINQTVGNAMLDWIARAINPPSYMTSIQTSNPPVPPYQILVSEGTYVAFSQDPNAKTGPTGFGEPNYVSPSGAFGYRIDFENDAHATSPAQQVVITDQLSRDLDWATFQLSEIGFGDSWIVVPAGSRSFEHTEHVTYDGVDFDVQIEVTLNPASGALSATFRSVDPRTGLPPPVNIGFLPPENGTGRGQGHLSYTIAPRHGLSTGTAIRNVALISFDGQPTIATNQRDPHDASRGTDPTKEALLTIDADAPTCDVVVRPIAGSPNRHTVGWSGNDSGAGVAGFDIYMSIDDGPWMLWQVSATASSAAFDAMAGRTYRFFGQARDAAGNLGNPSSEVRPAALSQLVNFSIRSAAGLGSDTLIVGFVVSGGANKSLLVRGVGPSLGGQDVQGPLADPILTLYSGTGAVIDSNDDWGSTANGSVIAATTLKLGAFALPDDSRDAVVMPTLASGVYTVHVTGKSTTTGVALTEVYDAAVTTSAARLVNASARTRVGTGDQILIAGFVIVGDGSRPLLIRGIGPTLAELGVEGVLNDPQLVLYRQGVATPLEQNDNWGGTTVLRTAFGSTGASSLDGSSKDAAVLVTLPAGAYTVHVSGVGNTTGVALVEVYELP
ncbi:RHS repeat-associated core domain-containing protein [Opitutus terrae]|nr:RHS repeat-associated core domain-containing protein [Opitutus terrae]